MEYRVSGYMALEVFRWNASLVILDTVVNALVISGLTILLICYMAQLTRTLSDYIQRLQNIAARLIMRVPKYSIITPELKELH